MNRKYQILLHHKMNMKILTIIAVLIAVLTIGNTIALVMHETKLNVHETRMNGFDETTRVVAQMYQIMANPQNFVQFIQQSADEVKNEALK